MLQQEKELINLIGISKLASKLAQEIIIYIYIFCIFATTIWMFEWQIFHGEEQEIKF